MRKTKRISLSWSDKLLYYAPVALLLGIPAFFAPDFYKIYVSHTYTGLRSPNEVLEVTIPFIIAAFILYFLLKRDLILQEEDISQDYEQFKNALQRAALQGGWDVTHCDHNYAMAISNNGAIITIIRTDTSLLISSRCDGYSPLVLGTVKKYKRLLLSNLNEVKLGLPAPYMDPDGLPAKEWTVKGTITRLILYPLSIFFILFSILFLFPRGKLLIGCAVLGFACVYLYSDLRIIFVVSKKRKS